MKRNTYFRLHNAVGLWICLLVLLSAVSGGILLFREQMRFVPPTAPVVEHHLPLEAIVARAAEEGGGPVSDLGLPQTPEQPYHAWIDDDAETEVWLDGEGNLLARRQGASAFARWMFRIHTGEIFGWSGQLLMLLGAIGLCLLAWSGVSMWWSRRAKG